MDFDPNGGDRSVSAEERLNVFALVVYVPDPLCRFLDDLRRELVPDCNPHAHVSVLPPRALAVDWREASEQARALAESWAPFEVTLDGIKRFLYTDVIYIELGRGDAEFRRLHDGLNAGTLLFNEPFEYHPHITLAQEIPCDQVSRVQDLAEQRWAAFTGHRGFRVDRAMFVRNTLDNRWIDLAEYPLGAVALR